MNLTGTSRSMEVETPARFHHSDRRALGTALQPIVLVNGAQSAMSSGKSKEP